MPETLGQQLKHARKERQITLEQASESTHIRLHYLQALEADDYSVMPSAAQARGFLKNYSSYLELNLEEAVTALQNAPRPPAGEMSGPMQEVDILPPPPEAAENNRPTRPISTSHKTMEESRTPSIAASEEPRWRTLLRRPRKLDADEQPLPLEPPAEPVAAPIEEAEAAEMLTPPPTAPRRGLGKWLDTRLFKRRAKAAEKAEGASAAEPEPEPELVQEVPLPAAPADDGPDETADKIFAEIGIELRRRRELLSLTTEEVEKHIHIREVFIRALEMGDFSELPSAVQTRGMLANYATFLDLDADVLLLRFADSLQASHRARHPVLPGKMRAPLDVRPRVPPLRSFMAGDLIYGMAIVVMVIALIVWGLDRLFADQSATVVLPTAPSISDVLAGTSMPSLNQEVTLIPVADTPLVAEESTATPEVNLEIPAFDPNVTVRLTVIASERTFMRVMVDGEEAFNGRVIPGAVYTYDATTTVQLLTGNGAALRVTYNGRDLGLLGTFGQVANFIYTANDIVTPVPPAPPTATPTRPLSPTPSSSPTTTPTRTITPRPQ